MYQTLVGIGMVVVGSAIVIFSERITQVTAALHRRTLGIELPRGWRRGEALWLKTYYPGPLTSDTQPGS